jgi:LPXTG-site transpeptidase (sortase) family protein
LIGLAALRPEAFPPLEITLRGRPLPATPTPAYAGTPLALPPGPEAADELPSSDTVSQNEALLLLPAMPLADESAPSPAPAVVPPPVFGAPERLVIPAIGLDAPVQPVGWTAVQVGGMTFGQWAVPEGFAAGWHTDSARPGAAGNVVLNGHHNAGGRVFARLIDLRPRDAVIVRAGGDDFHYTVSQIMVLAEADQPPEVRLANAAWIRPGGQPRLTLVTCWPPDGNSHRLIVIAVPAE